jgi:hypothetical protein
VIVCLRGVDVLIAISASDVVMAFLRPVVSAVTVALAVWLLVAVLLLRLCHSSYQLSVISYQLISNDRAIWLRLTDS